MGAELKVADAISSLTFSPIMAVDTIIVVYLHSIPVRLSKMPAHVSLMLR